MVRPVLPSTEAPLRGGKRPGLFQKRTSGEAARDTDLQGILQMTLEVSYREKTFDSRMTPPQVYQLMAILPTLMLM